jgi:hypothetical protein
LTSERLDSDVDSIPVGDDRVDQLTSKRGRFFIPLAVGKVPLEDGTGGSLAELGLEDRGQGEPPPGALRPLPIAGAASGHRGAFLGAEAVDHDRHALGFEPEQTLDRSRDCRFHVSRER